MKCPHSIVSFRVTEYERTKFRIWFPFFVLWPLLLVFLLLTAVATLLADLVFALRGEKHTYTRLLFGCVGLVGETRGTQIQIDDKSNRNRSVALTLR
jgi:hypothetical protein